MSYYDKTYRYVRNTSELVQLPKIGQKIVDIESGEVFTVIALTFGKISAIEFTGDKNGFPGSVLASEFHNYYKLQGA